MQQQLVGKCRKGQWPPFLLCFQRCCRWVGSWKGGAEGLEEMGGKAKCAPLVQSQAACTCSPFTGGACMKGTTQLLHCTVHVLQVALASLEVTGASTAVSALCLAEGSS